jgi:hypothetical protein
MFKHLASAVEDFAYVGAPWHLLPVNPEGRRGSTRQQYNQSITTEDVKA